MADTFERRINAIRWRLGLPFNQRDGVEMESEWKLLQFNESELEMVSKQLSKLLTAAAYQALTGKIHLQSVVQDEETLRAIWAVMNNVVNEKQKQLLPKISGLIVNALKQQGGQVSSSKQPATRIPTPSSNISNRPPLHKPPSLPQTQPPPMADPPNSVQSPTKSSWKWLPIPDDPDKHSESDARLFDATEGYRLFGARVRGKKHKHEGTNCDDWFECDNAGRWTIVAVSDGAGSKKFSRVGAKTACQAAIKILKRELAEIVPPAVNVAEWNKAISSRDDSGLFLDPFLKAIAASLHSAMVSAYSAVRNAVEERCQQPNSELYFKILGRPIEIGDLSATLLLMVHRVIEIEGVKCDFLMACQIGDGMVGAVRQNGDVHLLGKADGGEFSGETEFLTSNGKLEPNYLNKKTFVSINQFQAMMVMTDGVADDYFPNNDELGRLWSDLLLNRIPDTKVSADTPNATLPPGLSDCDEINELVVENLSRPELKLRSTAKVADLIGLSVADAAKRFAEVSQLGTDELHQFVASDNNAATRLRVWLDTYTVRGSFDDRTLVVLHREDLP